MAEAATCNNKKMSLGDAQRELEQRGFKIVVDPNDNIMNVQDGNGTNNNNNSICNAVVGYHSECVSFLTYKIDTMVFVFQLKNGESLTSNRINDDLENYVMQKQNEIYDSMSGLSNTCPPHGFARMKMVIVVYYANTVDNDAMEKVMSVPARKWCNATFLAVQDENCVSSFMVGTAPMWGRIFYPELQYWAGLLTGHAPRPQPDIPPSRQTSFQRFRQVYLLLLIALIFCYGDKFTKYWFGGYLLLLLLIAILMWLYQQRRGRHSSYSSYSSINDRNGSAHEERLL